MEIDLCGHATLAAARALIETGRGEKPFRFHTKSGLLLVECEGDLFSLIFPARPAAECPWPEDLLTGLGRKPEELYKARDYLAVLGTEEEVASLEPDFSLLKGLDCLGVIAAAPGKEHDFVSRFFAPGAGINEDPVTGSSHCTLIPYWSRRLGKARMLARQISARGGELHCEDLGERVKISGKTVVFLKGLIYI